MSLIDRISRRADLSAAMLRRLEIDIVEASRIALGMRMQSIARTCMLCRHADACEAWLQSAPADSLAYRRFCPNARKLDQTRDLLAATGRAV